MLRFIAALMVVLFHYAVRGYAGGDPAAQLSTLSYPWIAPAAKYGYLGVPLFFLISGFVILMTASAGSVRRFASSRVARLYPAFWTCCTLTFVVTSMAGAQPVGFRAYLVNLTMLGGFVGVPAVDSVYWTLFVELRFYALVFLLLALRQLHRINALLGVWLVVSSVHAFWPVRFVGFILMGEYAPFFIAGAMLYLVFRDGLSPYKAVVLTGSFVMGLRQLWHQAAELSRLLHIQLSPLVVGAALALFFLVMLAVSLGYTRSLARTRYLLLGVLTYPLYLLHQTIGFTLFNRLMPSVSVHVLMWGTIALMLLLALLVHQVELATARPLRRFVERLLIIPGGASTGDLALKPAVREERT
jgi:peptidoglycan/LPS O-acetylase OafA/YrhL